MRPALRHDERAGRRAAPSFGAPGRDPAARPRAATIAIRRSDRGVIGR